MKNKLLVVITIVTAFISTFAHSPENFNYQAFIKDASSTIVSKQAREFTIHISPEKILKNGMSISNARVSTTGTVTVKFRK